MLILQKKAEAIHLNDVIFGAEVQNGNIRYKKFLVTDVEFSDNSVQTKIKVENLTDDGETQESEMSFYNNNDVLVIYNSNFALAVTFGLGLLTAATIFGFLYY